MVDNKKSSILLVLKVLQEYTDENHPMTQQEIIDKIDELYGLRLERKSVASSIQILSSEPFDYDINRIENKGYALVYRDIDSSQLFYIADALFSSKSLSASDAKKTVECLAGMLSRYDRRSYDFIRHSGDLNRTENKNVLLYVDTIHEAILKGKNIRFGYTRFDEEGKPIERYKSWERTVTPFYIVSNFGHLYVLGYRHAYPGLTAYRIDYMSSLEIGGDGVSLKDCKGVPANFKIADYLNEHIYLTNGPSVTADLQLANESVWTYVYDWFGKKAKRIGPLRVQIRANENALRYWCMQYAESITVLGPASFQKQVMDAAEAFLEKHKALTNQ